MEGYGVINLKKLSEQDQKFAFFSSQLIYPEKLTFNPLGVKELFDASEPAYEDMQKYWQAIQGYSLEEMQELYVKTFDFQKESTLYMTYFKFEDSRERGQILVKLKILYQMYGWNMPEEELSDYLPLICEFLCIGKWADDQETKKNMSELMKVLEDGTFHLLKALDEMGNPYAHVIRGLRATLKSCIDKGGMENE